MDDPDHFPVVSRIFCSLGWLGARPCLVDVFCKNWHEPRAKLIVRAASFTIASAAGSLSNAGH
jgi:hypothetical protein